MIERHPDHAMIYSVAVRPGRHGAGLGRTLLAAAERMAASWGVPELRLYTNALMTRNLALYARLGYRETGAGGRTRSAPASRSSTWPSRWRPPRPSCAACWT